jgi:hypothetical protein
MSVSSAAETPSDVPAPAAQRLQRRSSDPGRGLGSHRTEFCLAHLPHRHDRPQAAVPGAREVTHLSGRGVTLSSGDGAFVLVCTIRGFRGRGSRDPAVSSRRVGRQDWAGHRTSGIGRERRDMTARAICRCSLASSRINLRRSFAPLQTASASLLWRAGACPARRSLVASQ